MAAESKGVILQSTSLRQITTEVAGGMDEVAMGTDQIDSTVRKVNEISRKNKSNINVLSSEIAKFKVE